MKQRVEIRNGYKFMFCEQCDLDWNVPIQKTGFYVCPICWQKNRRKKHDVERKDCGNQSG